MFHQLHFFEELLKQDSYEELSCVFNSQVEKLGFSNFFYSDLTPPTNDNVFYADERPIVPIEDLAEKGIITTYPADWMLHYQKVNHMPRDPVIARAVSSPLPVMWNKLSTSIDPVMDEARQHGLASGVTVTVGGKRGFGGALLSITSDRPPETSIEMAGRHEVHMAGQALLLALHLHEALDNLPSSKNKKPIVVLTIREKDCLQWSAMGKTSWEMAKILNISERTANFHIGNAMQKLGVSSRHQAVARAISQGLICP